MAQWLTNPTRNHEVWGLNPGLAQWVKGPALLWAVLKAGGCSSDSIPSLGTSICCGSGPRKGKKTKNKQNKTKQKTQKSKLKKQKIQHKTVADGVLSQQSTGYFSGSMSFGFLFYSTSREVYVVYHRACNTMNQNYEFSKNNVKNKNRMERWDQKEN